MVIIRGGLFIANNVSLGRGEFLLGQGDIGISLFSCTASINNLTQETGRIDHTIDINCGREEHTHSTVIVENSRIRASNLSWGDCIRACTNTSLFSAYNVFCREPGGEPPCSGGSCSIHTGIGILNFNQNNDITIKNNSFIGMPWGVEILNHDGINNVIIENNRFEYSEIGGILLFGASDESVDLGGGSLGSIGNNIFLGTATYDVKLMYSTANIFALNNTWSSYDPDTVIWDKQDDPELGRVIHSNPTGSITINAGLECTDFKKIIFFFFFSLFI